jgi:hypothetical protein
MCSDNNKGLYMDTKKEMMRDLTKTENRIFSEVICAKGSQGQIVKYLEENNIFEEYRRIHNHYCEIALSENDLEALKRALFLQWQAVTDQPHNTGLRDFNIGIQKKILAKINELILNNKVDAELSWMLIHYYDHTHSYFNDLGSSAAIKEYCEAKNDDIWHKGMPAIDAFKERGQMGFYWIGQILRIFHETL